MTPAKPANPKTVPTPAGRADQAASIRIVACIFQSDGAVFAAVGELPDSGRPFRLVDARRFSANELPSIRGYLRESNVDLVLRVAPASQSLARTTSLPDGVTDAISLAEALSLIAESELPAQLPWYRRTGGRVRLRAGSSGASESVTWGGLLVGWHRPDSGFDDALAGSLEGYRQLWTTQSVALATILSQVVDEPAGAPRWAVSIDKSDGVLVMMVAVGDRAAARVLRLPAEGSRRQAAAAASLRETFAALGAAPEPAPVLDANHALQVSDVAHRLNIAGAARDRAWLDQFAIPASLVEAFSDPDPARRSLFNLHAVEPRQRLGLLLGLLTWLSSPARAAAVIGLCLAALLLIPLGVAYARNVTLRQRVAAIQGLDERLAAEEQRVAFYSLLRERRWPMTKLMADIATSTPEGITLEVLELNQGESVTLRGTAKTNDLVIRLRENLAKTRVFETISTPNVGSSSEGVQFQLQAKVSASGAIYRGDPIDDFAKNPLGKRMFGDEYEPPAGSSPASTPAAASSTSSATERPYPGRPATPPPPGPPRSTTSAASAAPPAPLSDDDIAKMARGPVVIEWAKRKGAANRVEDEAVKARLLAEVEKLAKRRDDIDRQGGDK